MALSLRQDTEFAGHHRWNLSVWVDGSPEELDGLDHVRYILHHTFPRPVRDVSDRATNFRLETVGWGNFTIYAKAVHRDGHETPLQHDLILQYPDGTLAAV